MLTIRVVNTLEEFDKLADQWNRLLAQSSSNNIFLTWEWFSTWAKIYLGKQTLLVLMVYEDNQIVGIAPLYIREATQYRVLRLRQVEFLGTGEVCPTYLDFIVQEKKRKQVLKKIYEYLYGEAKGLWDVLYLAEIPAESLTIDVLDEMTQENGKVIEIAAHSCCPVIKLSQSVDEFLKGISANERYKLRYNDKRLRSLGHMEFHRASLEGDVLKEMETFVGLHEMRWHQKGLGGSFQSRRFLEFHKEVCGILSRMGRVHLDFLVFNGEKIAGIYGYLYNNCYYFYLPGFNPQVFPETSPGKILLFHCICLAIQDGCTSFDLLRGATDYKLAWAGYLRRSMTLRLYNKSLRAAASKIAEDGKKIIKVLVR